MDKHIEGEEDTTPCEYTKTSGAWCSPRPRIQREDLSSTRVHSGAPRIAANTGEQSMMRRKQKMILLQFTFCAVRYGVARQVSGASSGGLEDHRRRRPQPISWDSFPWKRRWKIVGDGYWRLSEISKCFGLHEDVKLSNLPMDPRLVLTAADSVDAPTEGMISEYRSFVGCIGFAAVIVRYDIVYAVAGLLRCFSSTALLPFKLPCVSCLLVLCLVLLCVFSCYCVVLSQLLCCLLTALHFSTACPSSSVLRLPAAFSSSLCVSFVLTCSSLKGFCCKFHKLRKQLI